MKKQKLNDEWMMNELWAHSEGMINALLTVNLSSWWTMNAKLWTKSAQRAKNECMVSEKKMGK